MVIVTDSEVELQVFAGAAGVMLDLGRVGAQEKEFLVHSSMQSLSNVKAFTESYIPDMLHNILPTSFFSGTPVLASSLNAQDLDKVKNFLTQFWAYAAVRPQVIQAVTMGAAILPSKGFETFHPVSPMSHMIATRQNSKSNEGIVIPDPIVAILQKLGIHIIELSVFEDIGAMPAVFWEYCSSPTRAGVLKCIDSVTREAMSQSNSNSDDSVFRTLGGSERTALRLYMAESESVDNINAEEAAILKNLPILTPCNNVSDEPGQYVTYNKASSNSNNKCLVNCITDTSKIPPVLLSSQFLHHHNSRDRRLLVRLGVKEISRSQYYMDYLLTMESMIKLYKEYPRETDLAVLEMIGDVSSLVEENEMFVEVVSKRKYIRNNAIVEGHDDNANSNDKVVAGKGKEDVVLYSPKELFDPNIIELTNLLDSSFFPTQSLQGEATLGILRNLGLQQTLEWKGIVACAESIAAAPESTEEETSHKFDRGSYLLKFMDRNIGDLMAVNDPKPEPKSSGLFGTFLKSVGKMFTEEEEKRPKVPISLFLGQLMELPWCPVHVKVCHSRCIYQSLSGNPSYIYVYHCNHCTNITLLSSSGFFFDLHHHHHQSLLLQAQHKVMPYPHSDDELGADHYDTSTIPISDIKLSVTAKPRHSRPGGDAWMCSSRMRILAQSVTSKQLKEVLGWDDAIATPIIGMHSVFTLIHNFHFLPPCLSMMHILTWSLLFYSTISRFAIITAVQLRELSATFMSLKSETEDKLRAVAEEEATKLQEQFQGVKEMVTGLIPQLYQRLNNYSDKYNSLIREILGMRAWIWVGESFVLANRIALTTTVNAAPYLYQLPQDLTVYQKLLNIFDVKQVFTAGDYIKVLRVMAEETGQLEEQEGDQQGASQGTGSRIDQMYAEDSIASTKISRIDRLTHAHDKDGGANSGTVSKDEYREPLKELMDFEIDLACQLVTIISTEGAGTRVSDWGVYAPDNTGRLGLTIHLMNDDVPWMSGPQYLSLRSGCRFIHPNISSHVAEKMGVKSLRLALVSKNADTGDMFAVPEGSMEAFGQAESLTARLKTILDLYPDGNPIFSELVQNADDAGASVVKIVIDENNYETESLMDSRMAPLQGPSLLVYNDAVFTEADFRSLASIGQGAKLEKVSATGRFGLGFNSTYHLTDTPSFVSGEYLVIFDPHCLYAPGATATQPGLKIRCHGNSLAGTFKDQFEPFRYFDCDFQDPYQGTLFRFPLRTPSLARKSEISSRHYGITEVEANLDQLIGQLSHYLLFLRSVKTIEVYRLEEGKRVPELLHRASATTSGIETRNDQRLLKYFDRKKNGVAPSRDAFYRELKSTPDNQLPITTSKVTVMVESIHRDGDKAGSGKDQTSKSRVGMLHSQEEAETEQKASRVDQLSGATAQGSDEKKSGDGTLTEAEFLIVSGLRGGQAKEMACNPDTRKFKLIPLGGVAACLYKKHRSVNIFIVVLPSTLYHHRRHIPYTNLTTITITTAIIIIIIIITTALPEAEKTLPLSSSPPSLAGHSVSCPCQS